MIAFGVAIGDAELFRRYGQRGIEHSREPDSPLLAFAGLQPAARAFNLVLDAAARLPELEALVLLEPHVELRDPGLCRRIREAFAADPGLGALGIAGSRGASTIAWWQGEVVAADVRHVHQDHGTGELPAFAWADPAPAPAEVDTLAGDLLVLSPWALANVRFDETLALAAGIDYDFCRQLRAAGRRLRVIDTAATLHRSLEIVQDLELWVEAHIDVARKWAPDADEAVWKPRARRAEAEREAARAFAFSRNLELEARITVLERELEAKLASRSWQITEPLRAINRWRARRG